MEIMEFLAETMRLLEFYTPTFCNDFLQYINSELNNICPVKVSKLFLHLMYENDARICSI